MTSPSLRALHAIASLYRVALLAYPRPFRRRYGGALVQVFHDRCRAAARQEGAAGLLRVCAEELADLAATALKRHDVVGGWHDVVGGWVVKRRPIRPSRAARSPKYVLVNSC